MSFDLLILLAQLADNKFRVPTRPVRVALPELFFIFSVRLLSCPQQLSQLFCRQVHKFLRYSPFGTRGFCFKR
jgi:hypothetical protein